MPVDPPSDSPLDTQRLTTRSIRSFVIRNGRITPAQTDALTRLLPRLGIDYSDVPIDLEKHFERRAVTWLEIGFGNGDVLVNVAKQHPDIDLLGIEVHASGVGHALLGMEQHELHNVRLIQHDALEVLDNMLPDASIDKVLLLFPDPWHKKRHHKRRIVQNDFLNGVHRVLKKDGTLHCATDWAEYGEWMIQHLENDQRFVNSAGPGLPAERPEWRPLTRFEKRGHRLGHSVLDLTYRKV
ncbi:MAG: tRNA (guanosine(46)-N7)-methyltransferase TrmB [Granulosicoccus sp.]